MPEGIFECVDYHLKLKSLSSSWQKKNKIKQKDAVWRPSECGTCAEFIAVIPMQQRAESDTGIHSYKE